MIGLLLPLSAAWLSAVNVAWLVLPACVASLSSSLSCLALVHLHICLGLSELSTNLWFLEAVKAKKGHHLGQEGESRRDPPTPLPWSRHVHLSPRTHSQLERQWVPDWKIWGQGQRSLSSKVERICSSLSTLRQVILIWISWRSYAGEISLCWDFSFDQRNCPLN